MRPVRKMSDAPGLLRLLPRLAVPLVFLFALTLNSLAMSAPLQMSAAMAAGAQVQAQAMDHDRAAPHALHQGAKAAHCQAMAQCTGVPVPTEIAALPVIHDDMPRAISDERFTGLLPGPPFHPPIV